ncbi:MAG: hypothetical protein ABEJ83_04490 [Candidatus Nanohaloarchaea archaeon]
MNIFGNPEAYGLEELLSKYGGKGLHFELLENGGFPIPETYTGEIDADQLDPNQTYVVRSSASDEDVLGTTGAGENESVLSVTGEQVPEAINEVKSHYDGEGGVVVQEDVTDRMEHSGVVYTNHNGQMMISLGEENAVHSIVEGEDPDLRVEIDNEKRIYGENIDPEVIDEIEQLSREVEQYFGRPMDIELAYTDEGPKLLQTRPMNSLTEETLKEHEKRKLRDKTEHLKELGLDEVVLGQGNYHEILGGSDATPLSISIFSYAFSGDGEETLGGTQLGRNELGYENGEEISPWTVSFGGEAFYNFAGDALQFRPEGVDIEDMIQLINEVYVPMVKGNPDLLNFPELRMYANFADEAEEVGVPSQPYEELVENLQSELQDFDIPEEPPTKKTPGDLETVDEILEELDETVDNIREKHAKDYVKARRLDFFAKEDLRFRLRELKKEDPEEYEKLVETFSDRLEDNDPRSLRDAIAYDESIPIFQPPDTEEYSYQGSFELSLERSVPEGREFSEGREIPNEEIAELAETARKANEFSEKIKFFLHREYDLAKQLVEELGEETGFGDDIFMLEYDELELLEEEPILADYRIDMRQEINDRDLFSNPVFESDLEKGEQRTFEKGPELTFGKMEGSYELQVGNDAQVVSGVDQTVNVEKDAEVIFTPDNVKPGSHLYTVLSDYNKPVVSVPEIEKIEQAENVNMEVEDGDVRINHD